MNANATESKPRETQAQIRSTPAALRGLATVGATLFVVGLALTAAHSRGEVAAALRWTGIGIFVPYALRRRSLLVWTFFAMVLGAELGVEAPHFAVQTRFLGDIFLRLIRMIVAPLIFGGLVTGIAGHGELRGVGRVALKAVTFLESSPRWESSSAPSPSISREQAGASRSPQARHPHWLRRLLTPAGRTCC